MDIYLKIIIQNPTSDIEGTVTSMGRTFGTGEVGEEVLPLLFTKHWGRLSWITIG